jgi:hypothetical protein
MHVTSEDVPLDDLVSQSLLSRRATQLQREPFFHFWIDDFLPEALYRRLYQTFPSPDELLLKTEYGNKSIMSSWRERERFEAFCRERSAWRQVVQLFEHPRFVQDAQDFLRAPIVEARGLRGHRRWSFRTGGLRMPWEVPVRTDFEFSLLRTGTLITPHSDSRKKLVSMLLYLPDPRWQDVYGGSTRLFRPIDEKARSRWCRWNMNHVPDKDRDAFYREMEPGSECEFRPNRLLLFIKSECSFHDMKMIQCPEDILRTSFNVNFNVVG